MFTHSLLHNVSYPVNPPNHPALLRIVAKHSRVEGGAEKGLGLHSKARVEKGQVQGRGPSEGESPLH